MKTLILMRHCKSSWTAPLQDIERPLNRRGQLAASALKSWLSRETLHPAEILCSYAVRTMETAERLGLSLPYTPRRALYLAEAEDMLAELRSAREDTVLMVGHNPGIGDLAMDLADTPPTHPRFEDYPTGATTVFAFQIDDWRRAAPGTGQVQHFVTPRELAS